MSSQVVRAYRYTPVLLLCIGACGGEKVPMLPPNAYGNVYGSYLPTFVPPCSLPDGTGGAPPDYNIIYRYKSRESPWSCFENTKAPPGKKDSSCEVSDNMCRLQEGDFRSTYSNDGTEFELTQCHDREHAWCFTYQRRADQKWLYQCHVESTECNDRLADRITLSRQSSEYDYFSACGQCK